MSSPYQATGNRVLFWADAGCRRRCDAFFAGLSDRVETVDNLSRTESDAKAQPPAVLLVAGNIPTKNPNTPTPELIESLQRFRQNNPACYIIYLAEGDLSVHQTCSLINAGVNAIINCQLPDAPQRLDEHLGQGLLWRRQQQKDKSLNFDDHQLIGRSEIFQRVIAQAHRAALVSDAPVLIYGESGTGKQRLAELIHQFDEKRSTYPLVCVNCAAITGSLAESELFGHCKGAFTGATHDRPGYLRSAHQGTVMLDEVSELTPGLQSKLLRFLQENLVRPVGSDREFTVDVRIIAATNRRLDQMVADGKFRLDLYHRLNVIYLETPPLRQRTEDIPILFKAFLRKYAHYCRESIEDVDPVVYDIIRRNLGRGNIRELENIVRQTLAFKDHGRRIEPTDLPGHLLRRPEHDLSSPAVIPDDLIDQLAQGSRRLHDAVNDFEKTMLARLIKRCPNRQQLAQRLGITRRTLYNKLRQYHLD
ncbi:MAG: sigma-54-dependent Fis family transcriptional regulator [Sedimentisphaerales bacterium]|nr:sigma-54-dependent Fis family transcriptional regulator [Sedimentisphaerales bacterium]